jgi:hypothetical protein
VAKIELFVLGPAIGALMMIASGADMYARASQSVEGTIESSISSCMEPAHNRCGTSYLVRTSSNAIVKHHAGPVDYDLRRYLPVGAVIDKKKWEFSYTVDGQLVDNYPSNFFYGVFFAGLLIFFGSYLPEFIDWRSRRRKAARG